MTFFRRIRRAAHRGAGCGDPVHASAGNGARAVSGRCGCSHRGHRHRGRRRDAAVPFGAGAQMEGRASHRRQPAGPRLANALPGGALCRARAAEHPHGREPSQRPLSRRACVGLSYFVGVRSHGRACGAFLSHSQQSASGRRQCALVRLRALYRLRHVRHFCGDDRRRISCMALLSGRTELRRTSAPA